MIFPRSLVPVALMTLAVAGAAGCKDDPPPPTAEPAGSSSAAGKARISPRTQSPMAKVDPQAMKEYRADVCYFGPLTLRQARDAYLASLGKDEPSEKKIPSFGAPTTPPAAGTATPGAGAKPTTTATPGAKSTAAPKAAAKPLEHPKPAAAPAGTVDPKAAKADPKTPAAVAAGAGSAKATPDSAKIAADAKPDMRRPFDMAMRAPHDRNARACKVASDLKDPAMPDVDAALAAFAPYAVELAKNIGAASLYYQREEYKKDAFEKGKEFHKKLVADFAKLDELSDKLGVAVAAWHKDHPADPAKLDEGEKLAGAAFDDAREILVGVLPKKLDVGAHKERVAKLEKSIEALKTFGTTNATDVWSKNLGPSLDAYLRTIKDAEPKVTEKGIQQDAFLNLITGFTSVIEAKYRALTRALIAKGQTLDPAMRPNPPIMTRPQVPGAVPAPSAAPTAAHPE